LFIGSPCGAFVWSDLGRRRLRFFCICRCLPPNIAASFAAQGLGKPGFWFVSISLLPYGFLVAAAARLLKAVPLLACFVVGLVWGLNPSGWEGLLNSINS